MREAFAAIGALERLLATVDPHVLLQKGTPIQQIPVGK